MQSGSSSAEKGTVTQGDHLRHLNPVWWLCPGPHHVAGGAAAGRDAPGSVLGAMGAGGHRDIRQCRAGSPLAAMQEAELNGLGRSSCSIISLA